MFGQAIVPLYLSLSSDMGAILDVIISTLGTLTRHTLAVFQHLPGCRGLGAARGGELVQCSVETSSVWT